MGLWTAELTLEKPVAIYRPEGGRTDLELCLASISAAPENVSFAGGGANAGCLTLISSDGYYSTNTYAAVYSVSVASSKSEGKTPPRVICYLGGTTTGVQTLLVCESGTKFILAKQETKFWQSKEQTFKVHLVGSERATSIASG